MKPRFKRDLFPVVLKRLKEPRRFLQVLIGPRQVGKTTLAQQVAQELSIPIHYVSADEPTLQDRAWLNQQWDIARALTRKDSRSHAALLIVDEVQKAQGWAETLKRLWDEDTAAECPLRVLLSGSSPPACSAGANRKPCWAL